MVILSESGMGGNYGVESRKESIHKMARENKQVIKIRILDRISPTRIQWDRLVSDQGS
jgi:hypothetical protein